MTSPRVTWPKSCELWPSSWPGQSRPIAPSPTLRLSSALWGGWEWWPRVCARQLTSPASTISYSTLFQVNITARSKTAKYLCILKQNCAFTILYIIMFRSAKYSLHLTFLLAKWFCVCIYIHLLLAEKCIFLECHLLCSHYYRCI